MRSKPRIKILLKDSYLQFIKNSVGSKSWRNFYALVGGRKKDIMQDGELSCASFVSSVLLMFDLIKKRHATVQGTIKDMKESGWYEIKELKRGAILIWEKRDFPEGSKHFHIGFAVGKKKAISNSHKHKSPQVHHITYGAKNNKPARKIEKIFWHKKLDKL
jgi:hypothetical protein